MKLGKFDLRNLRQRDIAIVCIVLTVIAAGLWYFYMYRPTLDEATELENRISTLTLQVQRGEAARENLPALREEVALLEIEREIFLSQLPRESEVASLLDQLRESATASQVLLDGISQGNVSEGVQDVRPLGFTLSTTGTFGRTMAFLQRLEELQRFTKVRQIGFSVPSAAENAADP